MSHISPSFNLLLLRLNSYAGCTKLTNVFFCLCSLSSHPICPSYQNETGVLRVRSCRKKLHAYCGAIPTGPPDPILKMSNSEGPYFLPVYFEEEKNRGLNKNLNFTSARSHELPGDQSHKIHWIGVSSLKSTAFSSH